METNSKHRFIPRLIAIALFFVFPFSVSGQEYIREVLDEISHHSIIRHVSRDSVLIYTWEEDEGQARFVMATTGNSNPYMMYCDDLCVKDIRIFEKTAYLCGYTHINGIKKSVFGFFSINQFPNTNVYCHILDECKELSQIDVYKTVELQFIEETHLVMTGTTSDSKSAIADITLCIGDPYYGNIYKSTSENEIFDDVIATDNYVDVSSRNEENGIPVIYYWQFKRPNLVGNNIFNSNVDKIRVSSPVAKTPILLDRTGGDNYVSVHKISGSLQMEMTLLTAPYTINDGLAIFENQGKIVHPLEIKYNASGKVYDILARDWFKEVDYIYDPKMQIYHITSNQLENNLTFGNGTKFFDGHVYDEIWSIYPHNSTSINFVASGSHALNLRMYSYKPNQWDVCPQQFEYQCIKLKPEGGYLGNYKVSVYWASLFPHPIETQKKIIPFKIECGED